MRINVFSMLLTMIIVSGFCKILYLFDRIMIETANIETNASTILSVSSAVASDAAAASNAHGAANPETKETKAAPESAASGEPNPPSQTLNPQSERSNPYATNILEGSGYNEEEVKVLMELSKRREELDKYQQQLTLKESFLKSAEEKLSSKTKDLAAMEKRINDLMAQLDEKSSVRIKSLAKIYENMKPTEAAAIFDELEMPLLLEIIRNMKEQKVASIIAQMSPQKAKDVSLEFAKISDSIDGIKAR